MVPSSSEDAASLHVRYLAYASRVKAISAQLSFKTGALRYLAFTSDFGEAFRPTVPSWLVNASYGVSVGYIGCSVAEAGYVARKADKSWDEVKVDMAQEAVFQGLASLFIPFMIIHSVVHRTAHYLKNHSVQLTRPMVAKWAPSGVGLACVPLMPVAVDHPCEQAVEYVFDHYVRGGDQRGHSREHAHRVRNLKCMQDLIFALKTE